MSFFGSGVFYNSGSFYVGPGSSPADGIPQNLQFYRTSQDGIYVFWWGFLPAFINPALASAGFDLEIDTGAVDVTQDIQFSITLITDATHLVVGSTIGMKEGDTIQQGSNTTTITTVTDSTHLVVGNTVEWYATFSSPNLSTFTQLTAITFQNGNVVKGFAVPVAARQEGVVQTWYAQVRTHTPSYISDWSAPLTWTIPQKVQQQYAEALMNSLPDYHVYGKGDLLKPVNQRNSNLYLVENMYGNQLDKVYYTNFLTQTDNYITLCVDENLYQNFGVLFNFPKPNSMQYVDYRWILMNLIAASLVGSTNEAVILTIQAFTGVPPEITDVRDENDFFLDTVLDNSVVVTVSIPVQASYLFIDSTFVLEDLTTGLLVSSINYTTDGARGTWTLINGSLSGHTMRAMFKILVPTDPDNLSYPPPVIFDALEGATVLSGLVTFTNGSVNVSGIGTSFLSVFVPGQQITDPDGIYLGEVDTIPSNTSLTLVNPWAGPTEVVTAYKLLYTDMTLPPPILWDKSTLAWGVIITIFNPGNFILN